MKKILKFLKFTPFLPQFHLQSLLKICKSIDHLNLDLVEAKQIEHLILLLFSLSAFLSLLLLHLDEVPLVVYG